MFCRGLPLQEIHHIYPIPNFKKLPEVVWISKLKTKHNAETKFHSFLSVSYKKKEHYI